MKIPWSLRLSLNLRTLLKLAVNEELSRLYELEMRKEWNALYHRFHRSTLQCAGAAACVSFQELKKQGFDPQDRPIPQDLVWVPWLEKWSCVKCFETYHQGEMTHKDFDDPVYREWVKKEFGI